MLLGATGLPSLAARRWPAWRAGSTARQARSFIVMRALAAPVKRRGVREGNARRAAGHVHDDAARGIGERDRGDRARTTLHPGNCKALAGTPVQQAGAAVLACRDGRTARGRQQLASVARWWRCRPLVL